MTYTLKEGWWVSECDHKFKQAGKVPPILSWMLAKAGPNHMLAVVEYNGGITLLDVSTGSVLHYRITEYQGGDVTLYADRLHECKSMGGESETELYCGKYGWNPNEIQEEFGDNAYVSQ